MVGEGKKNKARYICPQSHSVEEAGGVGWVFREGASSMPWPHAGSASGLKLPANVTKPTWIKTSQGWGGENSVRMRSTAENHSPETFLPMDTRGFSHISNNFNFKGSYVWKRIWIIIFSFSLIADFQHLYSALPSTSPSSGKGKEVAVISTGCLPFFRGHLFQRPPLCIGCRA